MQHHDMLLESNSLDGSTARNQSIGRRERTASDECRRM